MKKTISRWIMRARTGGAVLRIPLLGVTAVSTLVTAIKGTFLQEWTIPIAATFMAGSVAFLLVYDKSGILNQQSRDQMDRSDNYVGPTLAIQALVWGRAIGEAVAAADDDADADEIQARVDAAVLDATRQLRDGIDTRAAFEDESQRVEDVARSPPSAKTNGHHEVDA